MVCEKYHGGEGERDGNDGSDTAKKRGAVSGEEGAGGGECEDQGVEPEAAPYAERGGTVSAGDCLRGGFRVQCECDEESDRGRFL